MELADITNKNLKAALKASAILDIEFCDDEHLRCFSYKAEYARGVDIATYDNGGGDQIVIVLTSNTILIKGFDHESQVSPHSQDEYAIWPGMYQGAPKELLKTLEADDFEIDQVTFCFWRSEKDATWQQGPVNFKNNEDDGASWLLCVIPKTPSDFIEYANEYYNDDFNKVSPERVYQVFNENT
ncbi:hypothetical protein [Pseudoalteromonas sp. APC 3355]|uniref:hypothetical protein n=1 Tax=Pseudoalteromonas sp. APC 3355 TaxID=3035199 RepID=UPI0025B44BAC|nr:hypothetical protein [Pseudoalteromonas sp. APC 3355]MDN3474774.1 hypothetical protein [Pseudoalteromonas sp. APC 3355]